MTTFYVDFDNGDEKNDGLTPSTAWASFSNAIEFAKHGDVIKVIDSGSRPPNNVVLLKPRRQDNDASID